MAKNQRPDSEDEYLRSSLEKRLAHLPARQKPQRSNNWLILSGDRVLPGFSFDFGGDLLKKLRFRNVIMKKAANSANTLIHQR
jgi:hypothetical protein